MAIWFLAVAAFLAWGLVTLFLGLWIGLVIFGYCTAQQTHSEGASLAKMDNIASEEGRALRGGPVRRAFLFGWRLYCDKARKK